MVVIETEEQLIAAFGGTRPASVVPLTMIVNCDQRSVGIVRVQEGKHKKHKRQRNRCYGKNFRRQIGP